MILNTFFDQIYVLTLQRAADRQTQIRTDLAGLNYTFFFGADKNDFKMETLKETGIYNEALAIKNHRYKKPMRDGQLGCSWSHRMIYEDMLAKGYKKVLILEDDVKILSGALPAFEKAMAELPAGWELLYLDYAKHESRNFFTKSRQAWYHVQRFFGGIKWNHKTISHLYPKPFSEHLHLAGFHDYTDAYAITSHAAGKLLNLQTPIQFVADNLLAHACSSGLVKGFILIEKLFAQHSQNSNPGDSYVNE
ncbi:MAG: glycosyltransferase family 25 protein [Chitinophagaceae bacterium]